MLATDRTITNAEVAVKNAPATGLLKCLVTRTVVSTPATAEIAAPARLRVLPRPTSARGSRLGLRPPPPPPPWPAPRCGGRTTRSEYERAIGGASCRGLAT